METESAYEEELGIELGDQMVQKGHLVQIPADLRREHDLSLCYIDAAVGVGDRSFPLTDAWVNAEGQLNIPKGKRDIYGVEYGDRVDLKVEGVVYRE